MNQINIEFIDRCYSGKNVLSKNKLKRLFFSAQLL